MPTHPTRVATREEAIQKLGAMISGIHFAMLTTHDEQGHLHSRPMAAQQVEFDGTLWFLTSNSSLKTRQIAKDKRVNLSYADPSEHRFVSVSGTAELSHHQGRIHELWQPAFRIWFPQGENDPDIALIKVQVEDAEYWDTHSSAMVHLFGFMKATLTGERPAPDELSENEKLNLAG